MVKVKKEMIRSDTSKKAAPSKNKLKMERQKEYTKVCIFEVFTGCGYYSRIK